MNLQVQVMPQQSDLSSTDERIIRRPFFWRPPIFWRPPFFWRPYFVNPFLAGLLGGVLGTLLVSPFIAPRYVYWYWYPYPPYPYYPPYFI